MDILRSMRDTFESNHVSAITSEKSSLESHNVFVKVENEEHANMEASIEDKEKIMVADADALPSAKTTKGEMETSNG